MRRIGLLIICCFLTGRLLALAASSYLQVDSIGAPTRYLQMEVIPLDPTSNGDSLLPMKNNIAVSIPVRTTPLAYMADSLISDSLHYEYLKIKKFANKKRLTKELYRMVFVDPRPGHLNVMRTQNSEERFEAYTGKMIRDVEIKVLPPYGTSIYDTTYNEQDLGWLKMVANKTHMRTAEKVILRQLTIKPGMELRPFELVQNEILLRNLDYIDDVSIVVLEVAGDTSQVDLLLVCKDEFSWGAVLESNFLNSFSIGLENKNFLKLGHVLNYEFSYRGTKDKKGGNILEYKVNSIWGTYVDLRGYYRNDYVEKQIRLEVERQFLTSRMKWAGGVSAGKVFYSDDLPDRNVTRLETLFNYHFQDVWIGRSFLLKSQHRYNRNFYLTGRFFTTLFDRRPQVSVDSNHFYYNRLNYLGALSYTKIKYYKANLIYDFGRTEDVPTGLYATLVGGFENSEFRNSGYLGSEVKYSHFNKYSERFYSFYAALGSYIYDKRFERGILKAGIGHISNLCSVGNYRFRFYNGIRYIRGIRRDPADLLYMRDFDIGGFSSDSVRGNQKLSMTLATTFFLPYIKRGFRTSLSGFVNMGIIAPEGKPLTRSKSYWGIGVGVNIRNDNVVIKNISFRFAYYPRVPVDGRNFQAILSGGTKSEFFDYRVSKPQVFQYE